MCLTKADKAQQDLYRDAKPDNLGTLHERMQAVMYHAQLTDLYRTDPVLWDLLHDLQIEVSFHRPAKPPYGHRRCRDLDRGRLVFQNSETLERLRRGLTMKGRSA